MIASRLYSADLLEGLGEELISHNLNKNFFARGANFDTREISPNSIFFAIKGTNRDGNDFAMEAIEYGASCTVVSSKKIAQELEKNGMYFVLVHNTINALGLMAKYRRNNELKDTKVVAITGSIGKTTTKQWVSQALAKFCDLYATIANWNNQIGMPITILNTPSSTKLLVLELGTSKPGEIEYLTKIAIPNVAIITDIHPAHIGNFAGNINALIEEKTSIFKGLKPGGVAVINETSKYFEQILSAAKAQRVQNFVRVGLPNTSHIFVGKQELGDFFSTEYTVCTNIGGNSCILQCHLDSTYKQHTFNTLYIFAIAMLFKFDLEKVAHQISTLSIPEGRGNIESVYFDGKTIIIINDSYNANPASMQAAIEALAAIKNNINGSRSICIFGDMLELGEQEQQMHLEMKSTLMDNKIDGLISVGKLSKELLLSLPKENQIGSFKTVDSLKKKLRGILQNGDVVLFKGSNSIKLSDAIKKLYR